MNEPTRKQIQFADIIAGTLGLCLPKENTKQAYWKFINDNAPIYYEAAATSYMELIGNFPEDVF